LTLGFFYQEVPLIIQQDIILIINMRTKPASKNPRTKPKKDQKDPNKTLKDNLKMICPYLITSIISILIGFFFFKLTASKKDIQSVSDKTIRIEQGVSQLLRQDNLKTNDYKKYLEIYQLLYKSVLEKSFPGGYTTFGVRDSTIFNPGNFTNKNIQGNIKGSISFRGKNCLVTIGITKLYFVETDNTISNISTGVDIENYEIGKLYRANLIPTAVGWEQYIVILSDDIVNPVFVFGFAK